MATWPALPYEAWHATCDTLHAHAQLLGKFCVALAPPEPELQHAALRLTPRGWETPPLPAPDGSGALIAALDLHQHETVLEHSDGRTARVPLTPNRPVGEVTRRVLGHLEELVGPVAVPLDPQEVAWTVPLDQDEEHHAYVPDQVTSYLAAATQAALALAEVRAPYRGRSSPVNAWWGSFDLAISLFSGRAAVPSSDDFIMRNAGDAQQVELGWWPGDARHTQAAFFGYAAPAPESFADGNLQPVAARWEAALGEYIFDWADVIASPDPHGAAVQFGRSLVAHACTVCDWDPELAGSALGDPAPLR